MTKKKIAAVKETSLVFVKTTLRLDDNEKVTVEQQFLQK